MTEQPPNQATRHPSNQENTLARLPSLCLGQTSPEPNEKIKGLAGNCSRHTNQARKTPWHGVMEQPPAVPLQPSHKTPFKSGNILARRDGTASCRPSACPAKRHSEPNEKIKILPSNSTVPGTETKPQDTLHIRKTPWHGVTKQPCA